VDGSAELQLRGSVSSGNSVGKIRNVEINELMSATTAASDKIYALLRSLVFAPVAGKNANEIRNSLHGSAKLLVTQGRIAALDLLSSSSMSWNIAGCIHRKKGHRSHSGHGYQRRTEQNQPRGLALDSPALRVTGHGVIDFDQNLNFDLNAHIFGGTGQLMSKVSGTGDGGVR